jgi:hypothetical protein
MIKLSAHFTLDEFTQSQHAVRFGIRNTPDDAAAARLQHVALLLEEVRSLLGVPIIITSGYRSPALNKAVGGSVGSQHMRGEAADFIAPAFGDSLSVCRAIAHSKIEFDQLIDEGGAWTHISFVREGARRETLTAWFTPGAHQWTRGIRL